MTFDKVIAFAREEHERYLQELQTRNDPDEDFPLPHVYLRDANGALTVFALAITKDPNMADFIKKLRLTLQAKILLEGPFASVYCGIVVTAPPLPPDLQRIAEEKRKTDPDFLETMAKEYGLVPREQVIVTAESAANTFVRAQTFYTRDKKVILDGNPSESQNRGVPPLPYCRFRWS